MKEHPLVGEIELITTGFAWWNHKPHREQLSDRLKAFEKKVREEAYDQGRMDGQTKTPTYNDGLTDGFKQCKFQYGL